jgi:hypothetical protein
MCGGSAGRRTISGGICRRTPQAIVARSLQPLVGEDSGPSAAGVRRGHASSMSNDDTNAIRIVGVEQTVGESPQGLPPNSRPDPLSDLGVGQDLVECPFHLGDQGRAQPRLTHLVVLRGLCDLRVSLGVEADHFHEIAARARLRAS